MVSTPFDVAVGVEGDADGFPIVPFRTKMSTSSLSPRAALDEYVRAARPSRTSSARGRKAVVVSCIASRGMGGDKRLLVPGVGQPSDGQAGSVIIAFKPRVTPIPKDDHDAENKRMRLLLPNARLTTKVSFERAKQRIKKLGSSLSFDRKSNKIMQPAQVDRLFELARKNDVQQMYAILKKYPHAANHATDAEGLTPMHAAATAGFVDMMRLLHDNGASVTATDRDGWHPFHFACAEGHYGAVVWLLSHGADMQSPTNDGWLPIHFSNPRQ